MKRTLAVLNFAAAIVVIIWGTHRYAGPVVAEAFYGETYKEMMFQCDHVMREHFIAKQLVMENTNQDTIRNLESAEVGLSTCHEYDKMRKRLIKWGMSENDLASLGLEGIEENARDIRKLVEIHEIRY